MRVHCLSWWQTVAYVRSVWTWCKFLNLLITMAFDTQHFNVQLVLCAPILGCVTMRENETTACNVIHVAYTETERRKWHVTYDDSPFVESSTVSEHIWVQDIAVCITDCYWRRTLTFSKTLPMVIIPINNPHEKQHANETEQQCSCMIQHR